MPASRPRLFILTTVPVSAWTIMRGSLRYLNDHGFEVTLVSTPGEYLDRTADREGVRAVGIAMNRDIRPAEDLRSLLRLYRLFRAERPDVVLAGTPKAGLVGSVAALLARVPVRVYVLRGLRLETARGARRALLWSAEWIATHAARHVVVVSPSLHRRARDLHLFSHRRGTVLGRGAGNGVDLAQFAPDEKAGLAFRERVGIPADSFVFGFVGRCTVDKGVGELAEAFAALSDLMPDVWLLVVGEDDGSAQQSLMRDLTQQDRVRTTGWIDDPAHAYSAMNVLVLPTYREGFPNAPLEAGAAGRPTITTTATGAIDSVVPEQTGLLVPPGDVASLTHAMARLAKDRDLARELGVRARQHVARHFGNVIVWTSLRRYLNSLR